MHAEAMISSHPQTMGQVNDAIARCIEACLDCHQVCTACADACLGEPSVAELAQCIRLDLDCADLCKVTADIASRRTEGNEEVLRRMFELCAIACQRCGAECASHAEMHKHCRICADTCRDCESACRAALATVVIARQ